ncbi:MAG: hypothetical protein ACYTKD_12540 [Planctomycetota bacterium]|jgi:hypothetical protein
MRRRTLCGAVAAVLAMLAGGACMPGGISGFQYELGPEYFKNKHLSGGPGEAAMKGARLSGYSKPLDSSGSVPGGLQAVLERASSWTVIGGMAELENVATQYDGDFFMFRVLAVNESGLGAVMERARLETDHKEIETTSTYFGLVADYMKGGRVTVFFEDNDTDYGASLSEDEIRYGATVRHVWRTGTGPSGVIDCSWSRTENDYLPGVVEPLEMTHTTGISATTYVVPGLGIGLGAAWTRGDGGDSDVFRAGLYLDLERLAVTLEYDSRDFDAPGREDETETHIGVAFRF